MALAMEVKLGGIAFLAAVGLLFYILACALYSNWLPLITLIPLLLAFIPVFLCGNSRREDFLSVDGGPEPFITHLAQFFTGFAGSSAPVLLLVLWHTESIEGRAVAWVAVSCAILVGCVKLLQVVMQKKDDF
eukprot:TRINITY_DN2268_c0_g1_i6.p2 TRINITY_DN2268_c0_g1~~TRINITY_DN2268_c0_g1_i6.p2  ORF type:complete len:132 (-),score=31.76 TRINITY_DN2268_c0_g1_i6:249-644(-)